MFPCTPLVVALTEKIIRGKDEKVHHNELQYITEISLKSPATMIPQAKNELRRMANMAQENLDHAIHGFLNQSDEFVDKIYHREEDINNVSHALSASFSSGLLTPSCSMKHSRESFNSLETAVYIFLISSFASPVSPVLCLISVFVKSAKFSA